MQTAMSKLKLFYFYLVIVLARLTQWLYLPPSAWQTRGDLVTYFRVAEVPGWPYFQSWAEYPPIFPFISEIIYRISGGQEQTYVLLFSLLLLIADLVNFWLVSRILALYLSGSALFRRQVVTAAVILLVPYFSGYFEPLVLLTVLGSLWLILSGKKQASSLLLAIGFLVKMFPALLFSLVWKKWKIREAVAATLLFLLLLVMVYGALFLLSPDFTVASFVSQANKGSWETIWALADGNFQTGNFGGLAERLDPLSAFRPVGNPARISPWLTLAPFVFFGFWRWKKAKPVSIPQWIALAGLTWSIFLIWLPGWSPQWVVYLLVLMIFCLPANQGMLTGAALYMVTLAEWPVLWSGDFTMPWAAAIILRTLLLALCAYQFDRVIHQEVLPQA